MPRRVNMESRLLNQCCPSELPPVSVPTSAVELICKFGCNGIGNVNVVSKILCGVKTLCLENTNSSIKVQFIQYNSFSHVVSILSYISQWWAVIQWSDASDQGDQASDRGSLRLTGQSHLQSNYNCTLLYFTDRQRTAPYPAQAFPVIHLYLAHVDTVTSHQAGSSVSEGGGE